MQGKDEIRRNRLKAALRDNLKRRKAQARARAVETRPPAESDEAGDPGRDTGDRLRLDEG